MPVLIILMNCVYENPFAVSNFYVYYDRTCYYYYLSTKLFCE
jgi:hypothetical protein